MSKYDFSGIPTDILREAVAQQYRSTCCGISCNEHSCPFYSADSLCDNDTIEAQRLFKEELERRDNMESNKMPEIKEGQVVKIKWDDEEVDYYLNVGGYGLNLNEDYFLTSRKDEWEGWGRKVLAVYDIDLPCSLNNIKDNLELIWEKSPEKTEQELKIEELQKTIEEASKQIEELKEMED